MATQEKLLKSLEVLRNLSSPNLIADTSKKKEKIQHCHVVTEAISNATIKVAPNIHNHLSVAVEVLLNLCDDPESDVRMTAEECLNRVVRTMSDVNISKVQIELHKGIKKNGPAKCLRAALWRFAQLSHLIRPHKGKPYVVNLLPTLMKVSKRAEEQIHETLAGSLPKIMQVLGCYTSDNEMKAMLKAFLKNVPSQSATLRRSAAACILSICLNCRKPYIFVTYVINCLLDLVIPVSDNQNDPLILGVMANLKTLLPHLKHPNGQYEIPCSFGLRKDSDLAPLSNDKFLQIYELCLHYLTYSDHNIINASLDALNVFFQTCSIDVTKLLLNNNGIGKSRIFLSHSSSTLKMRSPSQLSVATNITAGDDLFVETELTDTIRTDIEKWIDESKLSVINVAYARNKDNLEKSTSVECKTASIDNTEFDGFEYKVEQYVRNLKSQSIGDNLETLTLSENSSEKSFSYVEDERNTEPFNYQDINIGTFLDKDVSLIYSTRLIARNFLLSGQPGIYIPDKKVRVSVKSLALACLSSIFTICPKLFLLCLDKNCASATTRNVGIQQISDILLFGDHPDPQLRGLVRILISNFLRQVLIEDDGNYQRWLDCNANHIVDCSQFRMENLVKLIIRGLEDESSNCSRQSILCLNNCLKIIAESDCNCYMKPILNTLPCLSNNPYWLVKVALCELVCQLPFVTLHDITKSNKFQNRIVHNVLFKFLGDDDLRVRNSAANAIVSSIPYLYCEDFQIKESATTAKALYYRNVYLSNLCDKGVENNSKHITENMPFPFRRIGEKSCEMMEFSLSKIIANLYNFIMTSTSRHFICGCIETLSLLSDVYPTTVYTQAWNCFRNLPNSTDLLNISINLLRHSILIYDLSCHHHMLNLSSNLYAGHSLCLSKPMPDMENNSDLWEMFPSNKTMQNLSEQYLIHLVKLLNIFHHVLDETVPLIPPSKAVLSNLSSANTLSPIKRRKSDLDKKLISPGKSSEKDDKPERKENVKINTIGAFVHLPHYMKIYEILRCSYTNYKISLESEACEKFLGLLRQTLKTFAIVMEVGSLIEFRRIADEILGYFRATFLLEPEATVECVQQLLKCLFGTNLTANIAEIFPEAQKPKSNFNTGDASGFYYNISQKPYNDVSASINSLKNLNKIECYNDNTVMGYLHRKNSKKPTALSRTSDKVLANYIRIFEPMVIKSLKQYTITSNVKLQCRVLQLLSQLIQLRVNYCLLDSEQVFIGFVLKQFEYIEEGQIPFSDELIPKVFQFLVQLSYSKQHSKSIISIPKIIQLGDGLMASGQSPITHCIPALQPIVEDIFLTRNKSNTFDVKELETTREVVLAMLLRLSEFHQVLDLIVLILEDSKYCSDDPDKWSRWSEQVINVILPMLKQNKIKLDCAAAFVSLRKLVFALNPNVFKPIDNVILLLFQDPLSNDCSSIVCKRWLAKVLIAFLILSVTKEECLISKIAELKADFAPGLIFENVIAIADPLNVTNSADIFHGVAPEMIFVRFLFRIITIMSRRCVEIGKNCVNDFLVEELSIFLMYCIHIFQSGSHCKVANLTIKKIHDFNMDEINNHFLEMSSNFPILMIEWCYFLTLLNYKERSFWSKVLRIDYREKDTMSINFQIVRTGSAILFCDYLSENICATEVVSWLLSNNITLLVNLCEEAPIIEFITFLHRNQSTSKRLLEVIIENCVHIDDAIFKTKILKCVENTHTSHTGMLLKFLLPKLLVSRQLSLSRLVANLASRKIELLLTMSMEDVNKQLSKEDLLDIIKSLIHLNLVRKHEGLCSLLNKLCTQYFDISPLEFDQRRTINPEFIKRLQINKNWYLLQIRGKEKETAELLNELDFDELTEFMKNDAFNVGVLEDCIRLGVNFIKRDELIEEPPIIRASIDRLFREIERIYQLLPTEHQVFNVSGRSATNLEIKYTKDVLKLFEDYQFNSDFFSLVPSVTCYLESLSSFPKSKIPENYYEILLKFGVICLELLHYLIDVDKVELNINLIDCTLNCANVILKDNDLCNVLSLDSYISWLCSAVNSLYKLVDNLLIDQSPLNSTPKYCLDIEESAGQACCQLYILVSWLYEIKNQNFHIPNFLFRPIESVIISLSRLSLVNSYILIPQKVWKTGWQPELSGKFHTQVPPLPLDLLKEIDIFEEFIFRTTLLGWTSRQQFEETWMCLLGVLCHAPDLDSDPAEISDAVHASSLAAKAVTALLLQTLTSAPGKTNASHLVHVPRHAPLFEPTVSIRKLQKVHANIENKHRANKTLTPLVNVFNCRNFERHNDHYGYGQVSVRYLLLATKIAEDVGSPVMDVWQRRQQILEKSGLDVNSCLQFLLDFYTQLMKPQTNTQLRLLHEAVRSVVIISDLFSDRTQFQWMLEVFFELSQLHAVEDELLHQYLIVGICKAAAVLTPDLETYENTKKILVQYLKSSFLPTRIACLHGILYILEGCRLSNIHIGGISEEMQIILPCAVEYVQCQLTANNGVLKRSQEHTILIWSLAFFLIENVDEVHMEANFVSNTIQAAFSVLHQKPTMILQTALMKGLERLIIVKRNIGEKISKQIMNLALDKMRSDNPCVSILGKQMLLSYMYTDCAEHLENAGNNSVIVQTNPDHLVQTIEKVAAIFEHIKRGYMFEVEILCSILPDVLSDFFSPSDILTKAIGEFLSPQQPHPQLLSRVVFKVFERAIEQQQLSLLQDWVVFSLPNLTHSLSLGMATWCLTCFFISASSNQWLRAYFPFVQSRVGRYEYDDRKMLCIAGADFYNNLTSDKQKQTFVDNFNKVKNQPDTLFNDLLNSL